MWSKPRCFLMQGPQSSSLGQQLDRIGVGGLVLGTRSPWLAFEPFSWCLDRSSKAEYLEIMDFRVRLPRSESGLHHALAPWPWGNHLTFLRCELVQMEGIKQSTSLTNLFYIWCWWGPEWGKSFPRVRVGGGVRAWTKDFWLPSKYFIQHISVNMGTNNIQLPIPPFNHSFS